MKLRIEFLSTKERTNRLRKLEELQDELAKANQEIGRLKSIRGQFIQKQKELREALDDAGMKLEQAKLAAVKHRIGLPQGILDSEIQERLQKLIAEIKLWGERKDAAMKRAGEAALEVEKLRNARNNERRGLINAVDTEGRPKHPQYRHDFDPEEESNEQWQTRLDVLEKVQIEESKKLAAERRKDWERRLKDQVLNRLNENLQAAERAVRQLRTYLDVQVGKHKYRISQERDPTFSTLWSLLNYVFNRLMTFSLLGEIRKCRMHLMN